MSIKAKIRNKNGELIEKELTPLIAIREKCLDCCCWQMAEVRECLSTECALYQFRMGDGHKLENK